MADLNGIIINGNTYDCIDATARQGVSELQSSLSNLSGSVETLDGNVATVTALEKAHTAALEYLDQEKMNHVKTSNLGANTIVDGSDGGFSNMTTECVTSQQTYNGYNINPKQAVGYTTIPSSTYGMTYTMSKDGISLSGKATALYATINAELIVGTDINVGDTIYKVGSQVTGSNGVLQLQIFTKAEEGGSTVIKNVTSYTVEDGIYSVILRITYTATVYNGTVDESITNAKLMFTTTPNLTTDDYEPYVGAKASPNPDYPQEIVTSSKIYVQKCRKNIFDFSAWKNKISGLPNSKGTVTWTDDSVTLDATVNDMSTVWSVATSNIWHVKPSTQYTVSWSANNDNSGRVIVFYNGNASNGSIKDNANYKSMTFTTPSDCHFITLRVGVQNAGDSITYSNIQLEEGTTATTYEPYDGTTVEVNLSSPIYKVGSYSDGIYVDRGQVQRKNNVITGGFNDIYAPNGQDKVFYKTNADSVVGTTIFSNIAIYGTPQNYSDATARPTSNGRIMAYFDETKAMSLSQFNTWFEENNGIIVYPIATPIWEDLDAETVAQLKLLRSQRGTYHVFCYDDNGHDVPIYFDYPFDLSPFIEYVKEELGITKELIYDSDSRVNDLIYKQAWAEIDSAYASAIAEMQEDAENE